MSFNLKEYYSNLSKGDVLLAYKGSITSDLINDILEAVEKKLEEANAESSLERKFTMFLLKVCKTCFIILKPIMKEYRRNLIQNSVYW